MLHVRNFDMQSKEMENDGTDVGTVLHMYALGRGSVGKRLRVGPETFLRPRRLS